MSETHTSPSVDLEELLQEEIPCGGVRHPEAARSCSRSAVLFTQGHGCQPPGPAKYKCMQCWQAWYKAVAGNLLRHGGLRCRACSHIFASVEAFGDYRPF